MSVSVLEGGDSWLREVTGKHGSNFLPFSGPSVGYWISLLGSLGNGGFGPNPSREVTGGHGRSREQISAIWRPLSRLLSFSSVIIGTWPFWAKSWPGGHGRSWEVTGYGRLRRRKTEESGGTAGKRFEKNERIWRIIVKISGKTEENGGTPKLNGEQRLLVRNKIVCKGMRSDTEEGGAKGCKARRSLPKVLQMVWASVHTIQFGLRAGLRPPSQVITHLMFCIARQGSEQPFQCCDASEPWCWQV